MCPEFLSTWKERIRTLWAGGQNHMAQGEKAQGAPKSAFWTLPEGFCSTAGFGPEPERGWDLPEASQ